MAQPAKVTKPFAVLHMDGGRMWAGGQNQVRLLMRELDQRGVEQLCICPSGSPLEERLRADELPVQGVRWRGGSDPRAIVSTTRAVRNFGLVHAHDSHAVQIALLPTRLLRVPMVAARRVHFPATRWKWNRAERVIAISGVVRESLLAGGIDPHRVRSVHSGVDVDELATQPALTPSLRESLGLDEAAVLVGNIGHLHPYKGQIVIAEAATHLPGVHWVIIGEGPERATLEAAIARHGVQDRVHLTGYIEDARRALPELDAFIFPSVDEPLGTSVLDAMACEIPVIGARAAGSREILSPVHSVTGTTLYPTGNAEALADRVRTLIRDPGRRPSVLEAQRNRLADYTIERTADQTVALYHELIAETTTDDDAPRTLDHAEETPRALRMDGTR